MATKYLKVLSKSCRVSKSKKIDVSSSIKHKNWFNEFDLKTKQNQMCWVDFQMKLYKDLDFLCFV